MGWVSGPGRKPPMSTRDAIKGQIYGLRNDMAELSKKKPDDAVNKFKLTLINELILEANQLLGEDNLPLKGFSQFDVETLPTNSDVMMVLTQYVRAL
jgi:hypothetical protein